MPVPPSPTHLQTDRLRLRLWRPEDLEPLCELFATADMWWWPFRRGLTADETAAFLDRRQRNWAERGFSLWAVDLASTSELMGYVGLELPEFLPEVMPTPEIGWRLHPRYWRQGYATEAARAALDDGFDRLALPAVVSIYEPENVASGRVMERLGMTLDRDTTHPATGLPLRVLRLSRDEWLARA